MKKWLCLIIVLFFLASCSSNENPVIENQIDEVVIGEPIKKDVSKEGGKIIVELIDKNTLHIDHQDGSCTGEEFLEEFEVYTR